MSQETPTGNGEPTELVTEITEITEIDLPDETSQATPTPPSPVERTTRNDPSIPTILWGLVFALAAGALIAQQVSDVHVDLAASGPVVLLGVGLVLALWGGLGLTGLGRARRR